MEQIKHISLSKLAGIINDAVSIPELVNRWVVAEIANINVNRTSGHCYLELIEKSPVTEQVTASIKATIWSSKYKMLSSYFNAETGMDLEIGMRIMFCCSASYNAVYSFSLNITDIDPTFTIGEAQKQRNLIIETLKKDGVFDMNKELEIPIVCQRIAVISSATAAGFEDFKHQLDGSFFNFELKLFPAMMQGKETQSSVCEALSRIANSDELFDIVVIIRGGGGNTDLQWFDSYEISSYIAQMPLPVVTGIGHQKDLSIADMVSCLSLKTPTAVASFIIERTNDFYDFVKQSVDSINLHASKFIYNNNTLLQNLSLNISNSSKNSLFKQIQLLEARKNRIQVSINQVIGQFANKHTLIEEKLKNSTQNCINQQVNKLNHFSQLLESHNPKNIIKRGFAIIKKGNKIVTDPGHLKLDDSITIEIKESTISSKITKIDNTKRYE